MTGNRVRARWGRPTLAAAVAALVGLAATLAVVVAPAPAGADTQTVSNTTAMTIPPGGYGAPPNSPASLYPSPVMVSGLTGTVSKVTAQLHGLSHDLASDVEVLLVGPAGQKVVLLSDAGGNVSVTNVSPTFDDAAPATVASGGLGSGSYKPTDNDLAGPDVAYPAPAPAGPYAATLSAFNGTDPNGTWNLYIVDDADGDIGSLSGGWTLTVDSGVTPLPGSLQLSSTQYVATEGDGTATITVERVGGSDGVVGATVSTVAGTATAGSDYTTTSTAVSFADGQTSRTVTIPVANDPDVEGIDETVTVNLSTPTGGATLGSPTSAQLRIQDNDARANAFVVTIPESGTGLISGAPAFPYPSNIVVSGAGGAVSDVNVTLDGLSHTATIDVEALLVAPNGATTLLMSDVGNGLSAVTNIDLTFDDEAAGSLSTATPTTGTYKPTNVDDSGFPEAFPAPAPAGPWGTTLAALDGTSPNGTWSLYVVDDGGADIGSLSGGWSLDLTTATANVGGPYSTNEGSGVTLSGSTTPTVSGATYEWDVDGDGQYDDATGANPTVSAGTLAGIGLGDGPDSASVRVRATAGSFVATSTATTLTITNVAPTATFDDGGDVALGNDGSVSFTAQSDPSTADTTATFRYSYDFDNNGDFEIGDGTYAGGSASASATVPASYLSTLGPHVIGGRIIDKDGGQTTYTTTITVLPPPNAEAEADAGEDQLVNEGDTVTLDGSGSDDAEDDPFTYSWAQTGGPAVTLDDATAVSPTFTAPAGPDTLTFTLTVDDDAGGPHTDTDTVVVTVNGPPEADAGPDQTVLADATVTLDGTGSSDPDSGTTLTYDWEQTGGPTVALDDDTASQPTFTAPSSSTVLTFTLTVDDGDGRTDTDTVVITVNEPPTADAGPDQVANKDDLVELDGTDSSDPDPLDVLSYSWVQTGGTASVTIDDATTATPSFTAPEGPDDIVLTLTVSDGRGGTDTDTVTIRVNGPPDADAGPDQLVVDGATVTLDGTGSSDPDPEDTLTYAWVQDSGPTVILIGPDTAQPTFTAPTTGDPLVFSLTVSDGQGRTGTDTVQVTVNRRPTAAAGSDQLVNLGDTVTLSGIGSSDPDLLDVLAYSWVQDSGTAVTLVGANTPTPSFTAPEGPATLIFELTVDDGRGGTDTDTVTIRVNGPPEANAGPDQTVNDGATVTLTGAASTDPDSGTTLTYSWIQDGGPAVTLTGANTATPSFTAPSGPATLTFELTVDDQQGRTDTDTVQITVNSIPIADAGPDQLVNLGDTVTLTGAGSTDGDVTDVLTYSWAQTGGSPTVTLTGADTATPSFTAPDGPTTLTFTLTVADGRGGTDTDTVDIRVNGRPTANAGPDQVVNLGDTVTLTGAGSTDPDSGTTLTYSWIQDGGTAVTLVGANTATPSFTAPDGPATLTFELTVDDQQGRTHTDTVAIRVNGRPTANAGPDQLVNLGNTVTLTGAASTDPDSGTTLTYSWAQTGGTPTVTLTGATTANPTYTAPEGPTTLTFTLTVNDGQGRTHTDTVDIRVNGAPTASAGDDADAVERTVVTLDGTGSSDPDSGTTLGYSWTQTGGPAVTLTGADTAQPTFTVPDAPAAVTFELTVDDGQGRNDTDTVTITSLPRFTPDEAFVDHTYRVLLGRDSEPSGRAFWVDLLSDGVTRLQVAVLIGFSAEASHGHVVHQRFEAWLGRPADAGALSYWGPRIHAGQPVLDLELSILASGELYQQSGGTNAGYVTRLYQLLMGRSPEPAALAYWKGRLDSGASRRTVADLLLGAGEVERWRVNDAYERILDRPADPSGLAFFAGALDGHRDLRRVEVRLAAAWVNQPGSST